MKDFRAIFCIIQKPYKIPIQFIFIGSFQKNITIENYKQHMIYQLLYIFLY